MGACIRKHVVYDMSCKRFQFFCKRGSPNEYPVIYPTTARRSSLVVNTSDSGSRGRGFESHSGR